MYIEHPRNFSFTFYFIFTFFLKCFKSKIVSQENLNWPARFLKIFKCARKEFSEILILFFISAEGGSGAWLENAADASDGSKNCGSDASWDSGGWRVGTADGRVRFRKILADGRREVGQSRCLDVSIERFANGDGWDVLQRIHQLEGDFSHLFQVLAAFCRVGASFNRVEGLDHDVLGASSGKLGVGLVWEDAGHQAVDVLDNQWFASVFLLEGVDLDVVDGAGMDFVSVALDER